MAEHQEQVLKLLRSIAKTQQVRLDRLESRLDKLEKRSEQMETAIGRMREIFRQQGYPRV